MKHEKITNGLKEIPSESLYLDKKEKKNLVLFDQIKSSFCKSEMS